MAFLGTGQVKCISNDYVSVHWWPSDAKVDDQCLCGAKVKTSDDNAEPGR